jgi:hypothetical protein
VVSIGQHQRLGQRGNEKVASIDGSATCGEQKKWPASIMTTKTNRGKVVGQPILNDDRCTRKSSQLAVNR